MYSLKSNKQIWYLSFLVPPTVVKYIQRCGKYQLHSAFGSVSNSSWLAVLCVVVVLLHGDVMECACSEVINAVKTNC